MLSELNSANKVAGAKQEVPTMKQLGAACSLAVGCAVAALLK